MDSKKIVLTSGGQYTKQIKEGGILQWYLTYTFN